MKNPKISVITVCYNSVKTIQDTLNSIREQSYENIEYIVVDGGSTDGTIELIQGSEIVNKFLSEPDDGIYDAMNKGIAMASGEVIGILNADDFYAEKDALSHMADVFADPTVEASYADLVYVEQENTDKVVRYWKSCPYTIGKFRRGWMPAHPTFFCRKSVYTNYGKFNLNYSIAADVELLFRLLEKYRIKAVYLPRTLTKMRLGGTTNQSWRNIKTQNGEILSALDEYYGRVSRFEFFIGKILNRSSQFFRKPSDI
jgi:glycosyltransferase involved in cell wall biosynthesis